MLHENIFQEKWCCITSVNIATLFEVILKIQQLESVLCFDPPQLGAVSHVENMWRLFPGEIGDSVAL